MYYCTRCCTTWRHTCMQGMSTVWLRSIWLSALLGQTRGNRPGEHENIRCRLPSEPLNVQRGLGWFDYSPLDLSTGSILQLWDEKKNNKKTIQSTYDLKSWITLTVLIQNLFCLAPQKGGKFVSLSRIMISPLSTCEPVSGAPLNELSLVLGIPPHSA